MPQEIRKSGYGTLNIYDSVHTTTYGVHSLLRNTTGIPAYRFVFLNAEAPTAGETITDNATVSFPTTNGTSAFCVGIVKDGHTETEFNAQLMPGTNRDYNVSVVDLGVIPVEVAPGVAISVGSALVSNAVGQAATTGTATGMFALSAATGVGTAANPEYVNVLVR